MTPIPWHPHGAAPGRVYPSGKSLLCGLGQCWDSPLSERLGDECWLLGVLTVGPTMAELNSFSREESPLPLGRGRQQ